MQCRSGGLSLDSHEDDGIRVLAESYHLTDQLGSTMMV